MNEENKKTLAVASKLYLSAQIDEDYYAMLIAMSAIIHVRNKTQLAEQLNLPSDLTV